VSVLSWHQYSDVFAANSTRSGYGGSTQLEAWLLPPQQCPPPILSPSTTPHNTYYHHSQCSNLHSSHPEQYPEYNEVPNNEEDKAANVTFHSTHMPASTESVNSSPSQSWPFPYQLHWHPPHTFPSTGPTTSTTVHHIASKAVRVCLPNQELTEDGSSPDVGSNPLPITRGCRESIVSATRSTTEDAECFFLHKTWINHQTMMEEMPVLKAKGNHREREHHAEHV
jgi:hypothetical protein